MFEEMTNASVLSEKKPPLPKIINRDTVDNSKILICHVWILVLYFIFINNIFSKNVLNFCRRYEEKKSISDQLYVQNNCLMSSYSPSGGIKEIACSVSNLLSLTHWWNWQSSIAIALLDLVASSPAFPLGSDFVF